MKILLFAVGIFFIISGVLMYQAKLEGIKFSDSSNIKEVRRLSVMQSVIDMSDVFNNLTNCLGCTLGGTGTGISTTEIVLNIEVPKEIYVNDTSTISLEYGAIANGNKPYNNLPPNIPKLNGFSLHSSGFEITPKEPIEVKQEARLPFTVIWTISPKKAGDNVIILNISETLLEQDKGRFLTGYFINSKKISENDLTSIKLPISVYTLWGISAFSFEVIKIMSILIGGVLTYPLLIEVLKPIVSKKFQ